METYFNQELIIAVIIPIVFWGIIFILDRVTGGGGLGVWLITGFLIIITLLGIGFISTQVSLFISIGIHSFVLLIIFYQNLRLLLENRNNSGKDKLE